jgi:hypothetical protein
MKTGLRIYCSVYFIRSKNFHFGFFYNVEFSFSFKSAVKYIVCTGKSIVSEYFKLAILHLYA